MRWTFSLRLTLAVSVFLAAHTHADTTKSLKILGQDCQSFFTDTHQRQDARLVAEALQKHHDSGKRRSSHILHFAFGKVKIVLRSRGKSFSTQILPGLLGMKMRPQESHVQHHRWDPRFWRRNILWWKQDYLQIELRPGENGTPEASAEFLKELLFTLSQIQKDQVLRQSYLFRSQSILRGVTPLQFERFAFERLQALRQAYAEGLRNIEKQLGEAKERRLRKPGLRNTWFLNLGLIPRVLFKWDISHIRWLYPAHQSPENMDASLLNSNEQLSLKLGLYLRGWVDGIIRPLVISSMLTSGAWAAAHIDWAELKEQIREGGEKIVRQVHTAMSAMESFDGETRVDNRSYFLSLEANYEFMYGKYLEILEKDLETRERNRQIEKNLDKRMVLVETMLEIIPENLREKKGLTKQSLFDILEAKMRERFGDWGEENANP